MELTTLEKAELINIWSKLISYNYEWTETLMKFAINAHEYLRQNRKEENQNVKCSDR